MSSRSDKELAQELLSKYTKEIKEADDIVYVVNSNDWDNMTPINDGKDGLLANLLSIHLMWIYEDRPKLKNARNSIRKKVNKRIMTMLRKKRTQ
jgi:hypothetical protein